MFRRCTRSINSYYLVLDYFEFCKLLKLGDRAAGAIKSGGTTRRAAKMVVVDIDHPDIEEYINWKVVEEQKVAALVAGSKLTAKNLKSVMDACNLDYYNDEDRLNPKVNNELKKEFK